MPSGMGTANPDAMEPWLCHLLAEPPFLFNILEAYFLTGQMLTREPVSLGYHVLCGRSLNGRIHICFLSLGGIWERSN